MAQTPDRKLQRQVELPLSITEKDARTLERVAQLGGYASVSDYLIALHKQHIADASVDEELCTEKPGQGFPPYFTTDQGRIYCADSSELMMSELQPESVDLIMTSPPFSLTRPKEYGNRYEKEYLDWFRKFAIGFQRVLKPSGSLVIDLGGAWEKGRPTRSLYQFELLVMLCRQYGFYLAQEFYWWNPAKFPTPAEWVNIRRVRVKDAVNCVWWLSKTPYPKTSNKRVLQPYSESMMNLFVNGYNTNRRPSGHQPSLKFLTNNGGAIPPNLIALANTESNNTYQRYCRENGFLNHPASFPAGLPAFFIRMLTDPGDTVFDPFGGSCVTGEVAEQMGRQWVCSEIDERYVLGARGRFLPDGHGAEFQVRRTEPYKIYPPLSMPGNDDQEPLVKDGGRTRPVTMKTEEMEMTPSTRLEAEDLHQLLISALGNNVLSHSEPARKPLELKLAAPLPDKVRVYMYTITHPPGGRTFGEHKIQLMVPGQKRNERASFDDSGGHLVLLIGYEPETEVFVLWDAGMFKDFPFSRNVQIQAESIWRALGGSLSEQKRHIRGKGVETVIACHPDMLVSAIHRRVYLTVERLLSAATR